MSPAFCFKRHVVKKTEANGIITFFIPGFHFLLTGPAALKGPGPSVGEALASGALTTGAPASGAPAAGTPASRAPAPGAPTTGVPAAGAPTTGAPASGALFSGALATVATEGGL